MGRRTTAVTTLALAMAATALGARPARSDESARSEHRTYRKARHLNREVATVSTEAPSAAGPGQPGGQGGGKSLKDAYLAALQISETIGEQKELWAQMNELETQAKGGMLPQISGSMTYLRQATPTSNTGVAIFPAEQNTVKITGDQPLFRGFRDFAALSQRKDFTENQAFAVNNAARQLFYDTATAYYNVLAYMADVNNYNKEIELDNKRLKDLQHFYQIGRAQLTDVLTQKSAIATLQVSLEGSKTQLETARDVLAFETGWKRDTPLSDREVVSPGGDNLDACLGRIEDRADVKLALASVHAYEKGIPIARGQYYPSVDLLGDYYLARPGALNGSDWDAELAVTIPIFSGGVIQSQVRQATSVLHQYDFMLSQARRTAEEEIRSYYDAFVGDQAALGQLVGAVDLAKQTFETEIQYYRNGLVTNLDVLTAITTYQDDNRLLDHQKMVVQSDMVHLQAATGQRAEIAVELNRDEINRKGEKYEAFAQPDRTVVKP